MSCDQLRIGEAATYGRVEKTSEAVKRVALHVAFVEPKRELGNVAIKMLRTGMMIDAVHPALDRKSTRLNSSHG